MNYMISQCEVNRLSQLIGQIRHHIISRKMDMELIYSAHATMIPEPELCIFERPALH